MERLATPRVISTDFKHYGLDKTTGQDSVAAPSPRLVQLPVTGTACSVMLRATMGPIGVSRLRQLAAELDAYPAQSAETEALRAWVRERLARDGADVLRRLPHVARHDARATDLDEPIGVDVHRCLGKHGDCG